MLDQFRVMADAQHPVQARLTAHQREVLAWAVAEIERLRSLLDGDWLDREDEMTPAIRADFRSDGFFERYARALDLVGNRHSKGALVALVAYLLRDDSKEPTK